MHVGVSTQWYDKTLLYLKLSWVVNDTNLTNKTIVFDLVKWLGKLIGNLLICWKPIDADFAFVNLLTDKVPADNNMLSTTSRMVFFGYVNSWFVVIVDSEMLS